jgi:hypothetical protein
MSKMSKAVAGMREEAELRRDETVANFMGGDSYVINPIDTLKMITASSIFGEPSYYRGSKSKKAYVVHKLVKAFSVIPEIFEGKTTEEIMESAIDAALDYDFGATLEWATTLRNDYFMRLNPQVIMVRAATHPKRKEWTEANPGKFDEINQQVMRRADEPMSQMAYYLYLNKGKKNNIPSIIKRSWAKNLSKLPRYKVAKYKNHEIGMIDGVRICHANSPVLDELMKNGTVEVSEDAKTWENLRSAGKSWKEIFGTVDMGHMALLRNIRGVFTEVEDADFCRQYMDKLKAGVLDGKQFPFRYYSAIDAIKNSNCNHKPIIIDTLEECMDIAVANFPKLKGKTMCLSDNSGSAWDTVTSEYGTVEVAKIDNLSSVITAACSDEGYVGKFGDRLKVYPISKCKGILSQTEEITSKRDYDVGGSAEGGIWEFFKEAIENKEHWDNIFIYSDMQAGHGELYGTSLQCKEYCKDYGAGEGRSSFINVFKLIQDYRKKVNPKVNAFCIQTAGYDNVLIPEYAYRTNILYGWTGKEAVFADTIIKQWDEIDNKNMKK